MSTYHRGATTQVCSSMVRRTYYLRTLYWIVTTPTGAEIRVSRRMDAVALVGILNSQAAQ